MGLGDRMKGNPREMRRIGKSRRSAAWLTGWKVDRRIKGDTSFEFLIDRGLTFPTLADLPSRARAASPWSCRLIPAYDEPRSLNRRVTISPGRWIVID